MPALRKRHGDLDRARSPVTFLADWLRERRETEAERLLRVAPAHERLARHRLYAVPDLEARGTVVDAPFGRDQDDGPRAA
jgi:hypothetical protein